MSNKTILLVEDDQSLRELVTLALEMELYTVIAECNGVGAIEYLKSNDVDLILLDLFMPVVDGVQVLTWLKQEKNSQIPVLVMTAMTDEQTQTSVLTAGAMAIERKPLDLKQLISSIEKLIKA